MKSSSIKLIIKECLPPIVLKFVKNKLRISASYSSYEDAMKHADGYDDDVLTTTTTKRKRRTLCKVPIEKSVGRVSERDVRAKRAHPVKDVSIMDGFCFNITNENNNTEKKFRVNKMLTNRAQYAENAYNEDAVLSHEECAYVTTGAVLPKGANCVVPEENVTKVTMNDDDSFVTNVQEKDYKVHKWIRKAQSDVGIGDLLLKKGERIEWYDVGILAAGGIREIEVSRMPSVALACTGDEIVEVSKDTIPDSNASASYDAVSYTHLTLPTKA